MAKALFRTHAQRTRGLLSELSAKPLLDVLAEQLPAVIWTTDRRLRFTSSFGRGLAALGLKPGQVVGMSLYEYFQTEGPDAPAIVAHREALQGRSTVFRIEWNHRCYQAHLEPLHDLRGALVGVVGVALDITEQHEAVRAWLESEQRYQQLFEEALDVVFTMDLQGNFTSLNKAAQRVSGYPRHELLGSSVSRLLEPAAQQHVKERIQRALGGETTARFELPILTRDGRRVLLDVSARLQFENGRPTGLQGIARDITERKRLEEKLIQTQKLEAIGELAGGVAHDFNNLLSAILGYTDLLKTQPSSGELVLEAAAVIERAGERAQQLANRLLGFARRGKSQNVTVDVHALIVELVELLKRTLPRNISLVMRLEAERALTLGDPGQIHQVFLNLALNARDAMPEGGTVVFRTEVVEVDAESFRGLGVAGPGAHLRVSVQDTGAGIAPEHLPRIFEPFFTTKASQGGTGMGLAMVYGIVKNHGGAIEVVTAPGCGTTFSVYLPAAFVQTQSVSRPPPETRLSGCGSILIVDDEEMVGRAAARMLETLGYRAVAVCEPREAIEIFRTDPQAFDLVLLDLLMPGMSGEECFQALKAIRPDFRAIVSSGYAREEAAQQLLEAGAVAFLPKPYQRQQLAEAVRAALRS